MPEIYVPGRRLGRLPNPPERKARALQLDKYVAPLPSAPATLDLTSGITAWPVYLNDRLGCCTCSAVGHMVEVFSKEAAGNVLMVEDSDVLKLYESQGYDPAHPSTDQGANEMSVLSYWRQTGIAGQSLYAYAAVDPSNRALIQTAAWLFYGLYIGIQLPISAQNQDIWDAVPGPLSQIQPGGWGGHAVNVVGFDAGYVTCVTWGALKRMTWAFWNTYVDECWACIPQDFADLGSKPLDNGFDATQLEADLVAVQAS